VEIELFWSDGHHQVSSTLSKLVLESTGMNNYRLNFNTWLLFILNVTLLSVQPFFGKQASLRQRGIGIQLFWTNPYYFMALGCLGLQAGLWPLLLRRCPLGLAYAMTSLSFINTLMIGRFFFGESITWSNLIGCLLIMIGVWLWSTSVKVEVVS
jgi:multidrug transporter EmrE-like cation transporter